MWGAPIIHTLAAVTLDAPKGDRVHSERDVGVLASSIKDRELQSNGNPSARISTRLKAVRGRRQRDARVPASAPQGVVARCRVNGGITLANGLLSVSSYAVARDYARVRLAPRPSRPRGSGIHRGYCARWSQPSSPPSRPAAGASPCRGGRRGAAGPLGNWLPPDHLGRSARRDHGRPLCGRTPFRHRFLHSSGRHAPIKRRSARRRARQSRACSERAANAQRKKAHLTRRALSDPARLGTISSVRSHTAAKNRTRSVHGKYPAPVTESVEGLGQRLARAPASPSSTKSWPPWKETASRWATCTASALLPTSVPPVVFMIGGPTSARRRRQVP